MRPNSNDQGFLASYFEFVDCSFIKEPRPHGPKSHKGAFLRTLLNNFPTICSRERAIGSMPFQLGAISKNPPARTGFTSVLSHHEVGKVGIQPIPLWAY